jgi:subtilisin family serine protease
VPAGEVLVKLVEQARLAPFGQDLDVDRDEQVGDGSIRRIHSRSHNVDTLLAKLSELDEVEYAEPNYNVYALLTPNDTYFPQLWGLSNTGQVVNGVAGTAGADIKATQAWNTTTGSRNNVVAVVDTGIDYTHPDLTANVWSAPTQFAVTVGGATVTCAAGTYGFNAITNACNPMDDNGHGTHVSGTIGAVGDNSLGVVGVNWKASIMGLKFLDKTGSGTTADAIDAIEFAIQAKNRFGSGANVRVLSNSWGGGGSSQSLLNEINKANTNGMLFGPPPATTATITTPPLLPCHLQRPEHRGRGGNGQQGWPRVVLELRGDDS